MHMSKFRCDVRGHRTDEPGWTVFWVRGAASYAEETQSSPFNVDRCVWAAKRGRRTLDGGIEK